MESDASRVLLFIDDEVTPIADCETPIEFELDTTKLTDGEHTLKIVSKSPTKREGIRTIRFNVRNGPSISIEGIHDHEEVDGMVPIMINAYDKGDQKKFIISGSETPKSVPSWFWILIIGILGWAAFFMITHYQI